MLRLCWCCPALPGFHYLTLGELQSTIVRYLPGGVIPGLDAELFLLVCCCRSRRRRNAQLRPPTLGSRPPPHPHRNTFTHPCHTSHTLSFSSSLSNSHSLFPSSTPQFTPSPKFPSQVFPLQHPLTTLPHNHTATTEYGYLTFTQPCPPPATLDTHTRIRAHTPLLSLSFAAAPLLLILTSSQHCPPLSSLPCHTRQSWILAPLPPSTPGRIHHRTSVSSGPQQLSDMTLPVCTQPRSCSLPRSPPRLGLPTSTLHASRRDLSSIHNKA